MPLNFYDFSPSDRKLRQGDIFKNLPYHPKTFLLESTLSVKKGFTNNSEEILKKVITSGSLVLTESLIVPLWGILASQDCDIRPNYDLIFYPLKKTKKSHEYENEGQDIKYFIDKAIKEPTRKCYLPRLKFPESGESFGPFQVVFQKPFIVPYNSIFQEEIKSKCWIVRLNDQAKKVFIGKLNNFFSRTPIEELLFLENNEISKLICYYWREDIWKKKQLRYKTEALDLFIKKIKDLRQILILFDRREDLSKIYYLNNDLLENIKLILLKLSFKNPDSSIHNILNKCNDLIKLNLENWKENYIYILDTVFLSDDSILKSFEDPKRKEDFEKKVEELKNGNIISELKEFLETKKENEIRGFGIEAEKALISLRECSVIASKYKQFIEEL